ncbi:MAG: hypothetical protein WAV10_00010 [Minisyncoccia bacterium]
MRKLSVISVAILIFFAISIPFLNSIQHPVIILTLSGIVKVIPVFGFLGIIAAILAKKEEEK